MAVVVYVPSRLGEGFFTDLPAPGAGDDVKAITYDHGTGAFVYMPFEAAGAVATHVGLADPHTGYLLADGSRTGSTSSDQNFTTRVVIGSPVYATGKLAVQGTAFPVMIGIRDTAVTNDKQSVAAFVHRTSGDMADGFGTEFTLQAEDDAGVLNTLGAVGAERFGADNTGRLVFRPQSSGAAVAGLTISPTETTVDQKLRIGNATAVPYTSPLLWVDGVSAAPSLTGDYASTKVVVTGGPYYGYENNISAIAFAFRGSDNTGATTSIRFLGGDSASLTSITSIVADGGAGHLIFLTSAGGGSLSERLRVQHDGYVAIGQTSATALLDLAASTTARASFRIRSGVATTSPVDGVMYQDGTHVYMYLAGAWRQLDN